MHLALALLLQGSLTVTEPKLPSREELVSAFDGAATFVAQLIQRLPDRLGVDIHQAQVGFTMHTSELGVGANGLPKRHTFVVAVFRESPAYAAGVRPGDRIVAIGDVQCDTLKPNAVLFYLADHPTTVALTLERAGSRFPVLVRREPLSCASATWQAFPVAQWNARLSFLRDLIKDKRDQLASATLTKDQTLQAMTDFQSTMAIIDRSLEQIGGQLSPALSPRCTLVR